MTFWGSPLHGEDLTVTVRMTGSVDADGVPTSSTRLVRLSECHVEPLESAQDLDPGRQAVTDYRVSAPGLGWGVTDGSSVTRPGDVGTWLVVGDPIEFRAIPHTEFTIRRVRG